MAEFKTDLTSFKTGCPFQNQSTHFKTGQPDLKRYIQLIGFKAGQFLSTHFKTGQFMLTCFKSGQLTVDLF